jgi:hypothetical protein
MTTPKLTSAERKLVDEYSEMRGKASLWVPPVNPHAKRLAELEKQLVTITDKQPADADLVLCGSRYSVPVGPKRIKRTIENVGELFDRLAPEWIRMHCIPNLGDLDKVLKGFTPEDRAKFISESRELSRTIGAPIAQPKRSAA